MVNSGKIVWPALFVAICAFIALKPYYVWSASTIFAMGVVPAVYLLFSVKHLDLSGNKVIFFVSFLGLLLGLSLIQGYTISYTIFICSLVVFPFFEAQFAKDVIYYFKWVMAIALGGALVFWVLHLLGIPLISHYITSLNSEFSQGYTAFPPFLVARNGADGFSRFFGPFDEPGVVGTVCLMLMYVEDYNLKDKKNLVIFIACLCSFSFVFIMGSLIYLAFYVGSKNIKRGILLGVLLIALYFVTKEIPIFYDLIYSRMEVDEASGKLAGDNRFGDAQLLYVGSLVGTPAFLWGDFGASEGEFLGARSILDAIISYGVVFCVLYLVWFISYSVKLIHNVRYILLFVILLISVLYQRPNFIHPSYILLFSMFIMHHSEQNDTSLMTSR